MGIYLVTGGAGFIGSNIVSELVRNKNRVRVIDNLSTGKRDNIIADMPKVDFICGDIRSRRVAEEAMDDVDYVLHQAALPSVQRSINDPMASSEVNISGTLNLLIAAKKQCVKRFVFASSSSIYGNTSQLPKNESMAPNPLSPYAVTKLAAEKFCQCFYHLYGLETVCLRYFNVFGPRQNPDSPYAAVIPKFIKAYLCGEPPIVYGDGEQSRDFTYIGNVVQANILACHRSGIAGEVVNIACGARYSLNQLIRILKTLLGGYLEPEYVEPKTGDVRHSQADISKAQDLLGYTPTTDFESGIEHTLRWYERVMKVVSQEAAVAG